jgi:RNA polymerase sigma factor (sigma-70 family)
MDYQEIIALIKYKDPRGLEALYNEYGSKLNGYAVCKWKLTKDEAWDVVFQTLDTLVTILSNYQFVSKEHFDNFIYYVFNNFLRQYYRKKRNTEIDIIYTDFRDNNFDAEEPGNRQIAFEIDKKAFEDYYKTETIESPELRALKEALEKLDPIDKDLLLLKAQNFSYEEISVMLKIENKDLKVKRFRAKQKLLELISKT